MEDTIENTTIDIVTTNGRYTALREGDPIWSGFLPDADVIKNDKEYLVSESVSRAIDSQWDAYQRLLTFLGGVACVEFKIPYMETEPCEGSYRNRLKLEQDGSGLFLDRDVGWTVRSGKCVTRRELLELESYGPWYDASVTNYMELLEYTAPDGSVVLLEGVIFSLLSDDSEQCGCLVYSKPSELVYYDEVDRIAHTQPPRRMGILGTS